MKNVAIRKNGWTITVKGDRGLNGNRSQNHGANTMIGQVPGILEMSSGRGVYNAAGCGACVMFGDCQKTKGVVADTDHCQFRPTRYQWKK